MSRRKRYAALAVLARAPAGSPRSLDRLGRLSPARPDRCRHGEHALGRLRAGEQALGRAAPGRGGPGLDKARGPRAPQHRLYGYDNDRQRGRRPADGADAGAGDEAHKTEPDKNTYLVFKNGLTGADPHYDYGTHFLFQGHEAGAGYITRINLDADAAHRVTLLATKDDDGPTDRDHRRSTWDPLAKRLLFTTENAERPDLRGDARLPVDRRGRFRRARPRRLRGHPERRRRQPVDRRGHRRRQQAGADGPQAAQQLHLPLRPGTPATCATASCRSSRC